MNYIVFYVENASPKIKQFKSKTSAIRFANKYEKLKVGQFPDNWVDCIIKGDVIKTYPNCWFDVKVKDK